MSGRSVLTLLIAMTSLTGASGCFTVREFIADRTQVELTDDISVCSQAVDDFRTCRPGRVGGAPWVFNDNFDVFAVTGSNSRENLDQIRWRYLGTPYYRGSLHLECHAGIHPDMLPDLVLADDVDLASELEKTTVAEIAAKAVLKLRANGVNVSADAEAHFKDTLNQEVRSKVRARFFWFLTKWTGGRDSIAKTPHLQQCVEEVDRENRMESGSARLVTGVAGLMVLSNQVDTTVSSDATILSALSAILPPIYTPQMIDLQAEIAGEWRDSVNKKFTVRGFRRSVSQTVYPLWVQFE
jgi:hypothetical protein